MFCVLRHLIFTMTAGGVCYYYSHFRDDQTGFLAHDYTTSERKEGQDTNPGLCHCRELSLSGCAGLPLTIKSVHVRESTQYSWPLYLRMRNPETEQADSASPFYLWNFSICRFWYLQVILEPIPRGYQGAKAQTKLGKILPDS